MAYVKNVFTGYQLVKEYAETLLQASAEVDRGTMEAEQLIPVVTEIAGKLASLADDVLSVHKQEERESTHDWRAMLREVRSRLTKQKRDKARWQEQKKALREWSSQQPEASAQRQTQVVFTKKAIAKLAALQLKEADCLDVLWHGVKVKDAMLVRKYNGYEIGVVFGRDKRTGQYIIFSAWKRERR